MSLEFWILQELAEGWKKKGWFQVDNSDKVTKCSRCSTKKTTHTQRPAFLHCSVNILGRSYDNTHRLNKKAITCEFESWRRHSHLQLGVKGAKLAGMTCSLPNIPFLWVCYVSLWCTMNRNLKRWYWPASRVSQNFTPSGWCLYFDKDELSHAHAHPSWKYQFKHHLTIITNFNICLPDMKSRNVYHLSTDKFLPSGEQTPHDEEGRDSDTQPQGVE